MKGLMKGIRRLRVGENICKLISDIELASTIHKELSKLNNITIYQVGKWAKDLKEHFIKEDDRWQISTFKDVNIGIH